MGRNDLPDWDDGRTIADMDVPGMPWHTDTRQPRFLPKLPKNPQAQGGRPPQRGEQLTPKQTRQYTAGALKAALLIVLIFGAGLFLFLLFCLYVWFRV